MSAVSSNPPFVITISRQLGSGGAFLGRMLASELGIVYADREILERAAEALEVRPDAIEKRDESSPSFVDAVLQAFTFGVPEANYAPPLEVPSYDALREAEAEVIREMASRQSAVIVGRGACHWLLRHPRHLSIFLHAETSFRIRRVQEIYSLSLEQATQAVEESDRARGRYLRDLAGRGWTDALQYDVSLCTSSLGLMLSGRILVELARLRFRGSCKNDGAKHS